MRVHQKLLVAEERPALLLRGVAVGGLEEQQVVGEVEVLVLVAGVLVEGVLHEGVLHGHAFVRKAVGLREVPVGRDRPLLLFSLSLELFFLVVVVYRSGQSELLRFVNSLLEVLLVGLAVFRALALEPPRACVTRCYTC